MKPYVFDLERSARGLRLNRFLHDFTVPAKRKLFLENPEEAMAGPDRRGKGHGARSLDWKALHGLRRELLLPGEAGAERKACPTPRWWRAFRGETLEAFLKTRRVPGAR